VLPAYAVPSLFVAVQSLPLNANGKVDRRALAARPTRERPETSADYRAPDDGLERALATLWADLLGITEVGADDDFFELGGNSLLATRITGEISTAYGVEVNPRAFYENPTVGELATLVAGLGADDVRGAG
jgi:acyl carrier protein